MERVVHCMEEPFDVYIGRPHPRFPGGSKWANPFKIGKDGDRDAVLKKFSNWLPKQAALMRSLGELEGKTLGCWCKSKTSPKPCHGDIMIGILQKRRKGSNPPRPKNLTNRIVEIPSNLNLMETLTFLRNNGVEFRVDGKNLEYKVSGNINTATLKRIIDNNQRKLRSLVGGCEACSAFWKSPSGPSCYFDAYYLGKPGKPVLTIKAKSNCRLETMACK